MLVNRDEFTCDKCGKRIESFQKPRGWHNPLTAEAYVCSRCWDKEVKRAWDDHFDWTRALREIKYPVRTFIGCAGKDDVVKQVMERFGVSKT